MRTFSRAPLTNFYPFSLVVGLSSTGGSWSEARRGCGRGLIRFTLLPQRAWATKDPTDLLTLRNTATRRIARLPHNKLFGYRKIENSLEKLSLVVYLRIQNVFKRLRFITTSAPVLFLPTSSKHGDQDNKRASEQWRQTRIFVGLITTRPLSDIVCDFSNPSLFHRPSNTHLGDVNRSSPSFTLIFSGTARSD